MRLLSLRLKHFKGVETQEIEFRPTGITLIQGPNEVGKTSLMSALDILLEYADSSQHREVEATKPSGQDRGTEIEARFQVGSESFTYFKRYHRERETRLTMENGGQRRTLTGREAHDYVREMLTKQTDWELWKALKIAQGIAADDVTHVALGASTSLREALDRAAGGSDGTADDTLFRRIKRERDGFYSANGRELKAVFGGPRERLDQLQKEVDRLSQRIGLVERDVDHMDYLDREIGDHSRELLESEGNLRTLEDSLIAIQTLESMHREELQTLRHGQDNLSMLTQKWSDRSRFAAQESELMGVIADLDARIQSAMKEESDAQRSYLGVKDAHDATKSRSEEVKRVFERLNEDADVFITHSELAALDKQVDRIRHLTRSLAENEQARHRIHITEEGLKAIRKQMDKVYVAQSGLQVGSPTAIIRALSELTIMLNGTAVPLAAEEEKQFSIAEPLMFGVPGAVDITMTPGASVSDLQSKLEREQGALQRLLAQYEVQSFSDAEGKWDQARALTSQMADVQERLDAELAGRDLSSLERRQAELRARVDEYRTRRPENYPYPETIDGARQSAAIAHQTMDEAENALRQSIQLLEAAKERANTAHKELQSLGPERVKKQELLSRVRGDLEQGRREVPDDVLQSQVEEATRHVDMLKAQVDAISQNLEQMQPDQVRTRATQLHIQVNNLTTRLNQIRQERAECLGRLATMGAEGLYEELQESIVSRDKAQTDLAALERRGQAAKMLYEVVSACRDAEQRRYREPLRKRINELGRVVFGSDFDVALDENLSVVSRTLHGITLGVEVLSTGAKEQLALLIRLAAASLVDPAEGVPIILDDTLGHTDDERLDLMASVLNAVAKECQIILLTSATRRYTKIGQAHVVDLRRTGLGGQSGNIGDVS